MFTLCAMCFTYALTFTVNITTAVKANTQKARLIKTLHCFAFHRKPQTTQTGNDTQSEDVSIAVIPRDAA